MKRGAAFSQRRAAAQRQACAGINYGVESADLQRQK